MKKILTVLVMVFGFMMIPNITSAQTTEIPTGSVNTEGTFNFSKKIKITSEKEIEKIIDLLIIDKPILHKNQFVESNIKKSVNTGLITASFKYYALHGNKKVFYKLTYHKNLETGNFIYEYREM